MHYLINESMHYYMHLMVIAVVVLNATLCVYYFSILHIQVSQKNYEEERQAPKGVEWKNWEGKKLKQVEDK